MSETVATELMNYALTKAWWQLCLILLAAVPISAVVIMWRKPELVMQSVAFVERKRRARRTEERVRECDHEWSVYVNGAKCNLCGASTSPDLIFQAERLGMPGLKVIGDYSRHSLNPTVVPGLTGVMYTTNLIKGL